MSDNFLQIIQKQMSLYLVPPADRTNILANLGVLAGYFGVVFDQGLCFEPHVKQHCSVMLFSQALTTVAPYILASVRNKSTAYR